MVVNSRRAALYKSFVIKNFRCFRELTVQPLERVNLIAGKNNVGKTALLEAIWLHHGYFNPELGIRIDVNRGIEVIPRQELMWDLFFQFDVGNQIELRGDESGTERVVRIVAREPKTYEIPVTGEREVPTAERARDSIGDESSSVPGPPIGKEIVWQSTDADGNSIEGRAFSTPTGIAFQRSHVQRPSGILLPSWRAMSSSAIARRLGKLEVMRKHDDILRILKIIETNLKNLVAVPVNGGSLVHGDIGGERLLPVPLMGEGMNRLLSLSLAIGDAQNGIVLVDEIENGLHHTVIGSMCHAIAALAREFDVQIFATTHSEECVRAAHHAFEEDGEYDFRLHRLERKGDTIRAVTYDQETLGAALEMGLEVR